MELPRDPLKPGARPAHAPADHPPVPEARIGVVLANLGTPDADGWTTLVLPIESVQHAHAEFLKLGADVEVLAPSSLRELMRASAAAMAEIYRPA